MKKLNLYNFLLLSLITILLLNIFLYFDIRSPKQTKLADISVNSADKKVTYNVYYVYNRMIVPEKKEITIKRDIYYELINLYKTKSKHYFRNKLNISDISIKSYRLYNNTLYIELNENIFVSPKFTNITLPLFIQGFVNTMTQTDKNVKVQFMLDNKPIDKVIHGVDLSQKFSWKSNNLVQSDEEVYNYLKIFFNHILKKEYKKAYEMMPVKDKSKITLKDFSVMAERYAVLRGNKLPFRYSMIRIDGGYRVVISYEKRFEELEEWVLIEQDIKEALLVELSKSMYEQR